MGKYTTQISSLEAMNNNLFMKKEHLEILKNKINRHYHRLSSMIDGKLEIQDSFWLGLTTYKVMKQQQEIKEKKSQGILRLCEWQSQIEREIQNQNNQIAENFKEIQRLLKLDSVAVEREREKKYGRN